MIPLMIVGDGPAEPSGLGRIARDLAGQIVSSDLPVELVQVGGLVPPVWTQWRHFPLDRGEDWGASCALQIWDSLWGSQPGILWVIWDPGRCAAYMDLPFPAQKWMYTAIDADNPSGSVGGPARAAIERFDRVLAYGRWGAEVLKTIRPVSYLPHGLNPDVFAAPATAEEAHWVRTQFGPFLSTAHTLIGCVATNQPRKDLGLYFRTLAELKRRGKKIYGWLHTDTLVKDWAVPQLLEDFGLQRSVTVSLTGQYTDRQLALMYQACNCTMAPGLGEGFGYPIVESLAAGVPVVHGDFGGGRELIPKLEWRYPVRLLRLESVYNLKRPVFDPEDVANAIERAMQWQIAVGPEVTRAYCQGAVAHLNWRELWPRWQGWIRKGLQGDA